MSQILSVHLDGTCSMHLLNLFKAFSANSSSRDGQSAGPSSDPSNTSLNRMNASSRKRRRLKRRSTKQSVLWQPKEVISPQGIEIPVARKEGFRSAPNLLAETYPEAHDTQSRSWSPIPTLRRDSVPMASYSRLRENLSDGGSWKSYERNASRTSSPMGARPPLDEQRSESMIESPVFGPREEGLFRDEMPYDMLASGWRESPRYIPRATSSDPPVPGVQEEDSPSEIAYGMAGSRSKEPAAERRHSPQSRPLHRTVSPESSLRRGYEPRRSPDPVDGTYYIIPGGMNVVFQDEDRNEITRVGDFSGRRRRISPIIVQDQYGREIYRTSDVQDSSVRPRDESSRHRSHSSRPEEESGYERHRKPRSRSAELHRDRYSQESQRSEPPTIILIDRTGRQIPIMPHISDRGAPYSE
ncbi:hypothetical protein FB451DRAFT_20617 [Mycena latifolia]|nr:hypothetical protein FB451DRAFT_20617 [Mycena latifolia]